MSVPWRRPLITALDVVNRRGKALGVRLVRYTGKSGHFIHPKHLVEAPWHDWYVEHLLPSDLVLDVGCANGAHTVKAARRARRVVGVDYDVGQLRIATATARALDLRNVQVFAWDLTRAFPFPDASIDTAVATLVFCTIPDPASAIGEIARVLKPEGRLLFLEHVRSNDPNAARWQDRHARRAAGDEVAAWWAERAARTVYLLQLPRQAR